MIIVVAPPLFMGRPEITIAQDFIAGLSKTNRPFVYLSDEIQDPVKNGGVYTSSYMSSYYGRMTLEVIKMVEGGDIVIWLDAWNPALPLLLHYCSAEGLWVRNYGIYHSSPTTPGDYLAGSTWAHRFQSHLIDSTDGIFVATEYMKSMLLLDGRSHEDSDSKIHVTGLPLDHSVIKNNPIKQPKVVYGHRWAEDKRPLDFLWLAGLAQSFGLGVRFQILSPANIQEEIETTWSSSICGSGKQLPPNVELAVVTKEQYYNELSTAEFVWANSELETFGYFVLEAFLSGAIPILNDHPCYIELYGEEACYGPSIKGYPHSFDRLTFWLEKKRDKQRNILKNRRSHLEKLIGSAVDKMITSMNLKCGWRF